MSARAKLRHLAPEDFIFFTVFWLNTIMCETGTPRSKRLTFGKSTVVEHEYA